MKGAVEGEHWSRWESKLPPTGYNHPKMVQRGAGGKLQGGILWRTRQGKELPNIEVSGWSGFSLADRNFEYGSNMGNPSFQANRGKFEAVRHGDGLINCRSVVEKELVRQAVDIADLGQEQSSSVRRGIGR
jgi:hypothetical protein